jgi:hypothetical protein
MLTEWGRALIIRVGARERVTYARKFAVIFLLCHAACAARSMQLRAQESPQKGTWQEIAAGPGGTRLLAQDVLETRAGQKLAPQSGQPSSGAFETRDFSAPTQSDQPNAAGVGTGKFGETHRFWDRENLWLFAGVGAARALDYTSTLNMRRRGRQEILLDNSVVDNHPLFAGIEAIGTGASIGVSYWLHRTQHHRLERWVSIVHIGLASSGAARNYALKTFHTVPPR